MTITITPEMEQLKAAHKATWDSGNYAAVADAFVLEVGETATARPRSGRTSNCSMSRRAPAALQFPPRSRAHG